MNGVINFYKPKGMTSHDAVYYFRKLLKIKKIGHGGTLDPNVEGVLPICIGKATRIAEYLLEADKEYIGELNLEYSTDSHDKYGKIINYSNKIVEKEKIYESFKKFTGEIKQVPPMYSALKVDGKKLYDLAREGRTVNRKARKIQIYELDIINIKDNLISFYCKSSKGTYIRTICNDIASDLGTYGHMSHLLRSKVGDLTIRDSKTIEYLNSLDENQIKKNIIPIDSILTKIKEIVVDKSQYKKLINGVKIPIDENIDEGILLKVYCKEEFIGLGEIRLDKEKYLQMKKVFI